ncbi:MAG: hypothetical protein ACJAZS_000071 [Alteromonas naphthalenivorans]|jgi:hypothetical protein
MKYSGNLFTLLLCLIVSLSLHGANIGPISQSASTESLGGFFSEFARAGAIVAVLKMVHENNYPNTACVLGCYVAVSELEQKNSQFFNRTINIVKSPWVFARKRCELLVCGGESLSWNELVTWRNRVMKLLSPLTKQATVVDLSKEKRLRLIDQDDNAEVVLDEQWAEYAQHIDKQFSFMVKRLDKHLNYYQDKKNVEYKDTNIVYKIIDPIKGAINGIGKAFIRVSIKRDEEVAFYLEEIKTYLQEIIVYSKNVNQLSDLDKDRVKRTMNSICDAFEHVATLIDADTAASGRNAVGQLTVQKESTGNAYAGGYGGYGNVGAF